MSEHSCPSHSSDVHTAFLPMKHQQFWDITQIEAYVSVEASRIVRDEIMPWLAEERVSQCHVEWDHYHQRLRLIESNKHFTDTSYTDDEVLRILNWEGNHRKDITDLKLGNALAAKILLVLQYMHCMEEWTVERMDNQTLY